MSNYTVQVEVRNPSQAETVWETAVSLGGRILVPNINSRDQGQELVYFGSQSIFFEFEVLTGDYEAFEKGLRGYGGAINLSIVRPYRAVLPV
jgi:hypothetical protein